MLSISVYPNSNSLIFGKIHGLGILLCELSPRSGPFFMNPRLQCPIWAHLVRWVCHFFCSRDVCLDPFATLFTGLAASSTALLNYIAALQEGRVSLSWSSCESIGLFPSKSAHAVDTKCFLLVSHVSTPLARTLRSSKFFLESCWELFTLLELLVLFEDWGETFNDGFNVAAIGSRLR